MVYVGRLSVEIRTFYGRVFTHHVRVRVAWRARARIMTNVGIELVCAVTYSLIPGGLMYALGVTAHAPSRVANVPFTDVLRQRTLEKL